MRTIELNIDLISEELYLLILEEFKNQHPNAGDLDNWVIKADHENESTHWVLTRGRDCDGGTKNQVMAFSNQSEAEITALEYSKWSDGIQYKVTDSFDEVKEYCLDYDLDFKNYM